MQVLENTKTIYDLVTTAGKEYSEKIFLKYEDNDVVTAVTYSQFVRESMGIAAWIEEQNVIAGHKIHVALLGSSSHRYLNALVGTLINGNVVVPLDPQLDAVKLADNLTRADVELLIYDWEYHDLIKEVLLNMKSIIRCVCFQTREKKLSFRQVREDYLGKSVTCKSKPEDLAVILFTSGTTGRGKGVMLSQGNIIDNVFCSPTLPGKEHFVYLSVLPIHHVFCFNTDVLLAFRYGYLLCLNQDLKKMVEHLPLFKPTNINMVPMMARLLLSRLNALKIQEPGLSLEEYKAKVFGPNLTMVDCGGGYLSPELAKGYMDIGISIGQGYGLSECSPKVTTSDHTRPDKVSSVGRIVERCEVKIVDGEIWVKSPSVMQGYYKDPEETAKVLDKNGYLHTGDLGYVDNENFLFFTGRKKNLIVLSNGENVAPEEIENLFAGETIIEDVLVFDDDDTLTVAIYPNHVLADKKGITDVDGEIEKIVARVNESLPSFKRLQKTYIKKTPFVKTTSKKIKRQDFFDEYKAHKENSRSLRMPENDFQQEIYDIIATNIGHKEFGIDTDLYTCGLDSMGSVMILTDLHDRLGFVISLKGLMENSTVLKLEAYHKNSPATGGVDYSIRKEYPLTPLQTYFAYVLKGHTTGNLPFLYKLSPKVDLNKLKKAVETVFDIHPELKATIKLTQKGYVWERDDDKKIDFPIKDVKKSEWDKLRPDIIEPFFYNTGDGVYHGAIYRVDKKDAYLFLDVAHIMGDGVSIGIIFQDINSVYAGKMPKKSDYNFYEYILDTMARKDDEELRKRDEDYYIDMLRDFKIRKSILTKHDCTDLETGVNNVLRNNLEKVNKTHVQEFCKKMGVSENVLFVTAFNLCISLFSNENEVVSTSIHSGRTDSRWNRITGPLFTTYVVDHKEFPNESSLGLLKRTATQIITSMEDSMSILHADEMFFQYQGDILSIETIGGEPAERQRLQLDSLPFHLQVFAHTRKYIYELRFWENRFDGKLLQIFMNCMEEVILLLMQGVMVRDIRDMLPESLFPKHYEITAKQLRDSIGKDIIPDIAPDRNIRVYILDGRYRKLPYGGWGDIYIADYTPLTYDDVLESPYRAGKLYKTGITGRILPDKVLDTLETNGRTVMIDAIGKRSFPDLYKMESLLQEHNGIDKADCYVSYQRGNSFKTTAIIDGDRLSQEDIQAFMKEKGHPELSPEILIFLNDGDLFTYEGIVEAAIRAVKRISIPDNMEHMAVEFDIEGPGEGAFYIEFQDGNINVQPYEYYDFDVKIRGNAGAVLNLLKGRISLNDARNSGMVYTEGEEERCTRLAYIL